ncbi:hypothetical protein BDY24DRAFT_181941 [Mrakia frigida]|uniref:uncharacterized protein n=1 Tax=Mrakia frigida TaxID=29902 RepID=UPI003FCC08DE
MSSEPAQPIVPTSVEAEAVISAPVVANGSSNETLNEAASTLDALAEASSSALELAVPPAQVEPAASTSSVGAQPAASEDPSSEIASASASLLALGSMTPQEAPKVDTDVEMESKVESEVAEPVAAGAEAEASGSAVALDATSSAAAGSSRLGGSLGRRTSSRSLATTAANAYLEHASDSDDDDDERSVSSVPRVGPPSLLTALALRPLTVFFLGLFTQKRGRASTGAGSKKSSASGSKRASTSGQSTPKEGSSVCTFFFSTRNRKADPAFFRRYQHSELLSPWLKSGTCP